VGAEQRKFPRRHLSTTIKITLPDQTTMNGVGLDISVQGIGFIIRSLVKVGQTCFVDFDLVIYGKKEHVHAEVIIAHSAFIGIQGYRTGVQFSTISPEHLGHVQTFMR
jgi:c-di-GMP-binding flagellar brake protein YcgR